MGPSTPLTDGQIRRLARKRVEFRHHAAAYVLVNLFLVALWWATDREGAYWPIWVHLGWGLGLAFSAWHAYGPTQDAVAREEQKLREKQGKAL